ncbi:hypothetical protein Leryth_019373 [Lithospermum erythrorhizon]|nr:hypothetical protein Leryth_019373 [Lithospermum erythrorhizon]
MLSTMLTTQRQFNLHLNFAGLTNFLNYLVLSAGKK